MALKTWNLILEIPQGTGKEGKNLNDKQKANPNERKQISRILAENRS
jgi:hypothetical protein